MSSAEHDQIRRDQMNYGRTVRPHDEDVETRYSNRLSLRRSVNKPAAQSAQAPKGHEAFLKNLEASGATVCFTIRSSGEKVTGLIKASDKYTVSVVQPIEGSDRYLTRVLFKHDISEFSPVIVPSGKVISPESLGVH